MLNDLPVELLDHIISYLPTAESCARLAGCCRNLHKHFRDVGWKVFVQSKFPSYAVSNNWPEAAHSLSNCSRNLDRRAFLARYVEPSNFIVKLPQRELETQWRRPKGQTMGYQPVIDSYEQSTGPELEARRQTLAWSAGAELVLRVKSLGGKRKADSRGTYSYYDHYGHHTRWFTHRPKKASEGRDDITYLGLLKDAYRQEASSSTDVEHVVMGTASGNLSLLHLELDRASSNTLGGVFETTKRPVRSAVIEPEKEQLLAACLGDQTLALYMIPQFLYSAPETYETILPLEERPILSTDNTRSFRVWATQFLSKDLLALGTGPCKQPVQVYGVTPGGLSHQPIRSFEVKETGIETSVYSIKPLPPAVGFNTDKIFITGGYDGDARVHDLRAPDAFVQSYFDSTDDGAIYSLEVFGRERFVAGCARNALMKFWDLRVAGGRVYHYAGGDLSQSSGAKTTRHYADCSGWNVFLNPRNDPSPRWTYRRARAVESPVYSLSIPSPMSPSIFAGVENHIVQLDFISMLDKHPDPIFQRAIARDGRGNINVSRSWNSRHDVLNLGMYEQNNEVDGAVRLRTQAGVGLYPGAIEGVDERWRDGG